MEKGTLITAQVQEDIFYQTASALVTKDFVKIDKIHSLISTIEGVSVRRRSGIYFGWTAFWAFVLLIYGLLESQSANFQQANSWHISFTFLSEALAWGVVLVGFVIFIFAFRFALFPPFGLYLEILDQGYEKEILVKTSLKAHELEKMATAIEKAIDWDYAPIKTI